MEGCLHNPVDRTGGVSGRELMILEDMAPKMIGLGKNSLMKFREAIINDPDLGPRFAPALNGVWNRAVEKYNAVRTPDMPIVEQSPADYIPDLTAFYSDSDPLNRDVIEKALDAFARSGQMKEARGGYDVKETAQTVSDAGKISVGDALKNTMDADRTVAAKLFLAAQPQRIRLAQEALDTAYAQLRGARGGDTADAMGKVELAQLQLQGEQALHEALIARVANDDSQMGRALQAIGQISHMLNSGAAEAVAFYDHPGFVGTGPVNRPIGGANVEVAEKTSPTMQSVAMDFLHKSLMDELNNITSQDFTKPVGPASEPTEAPTKLYKQRPPRAKTEAINRDRNVVPGGADSNLPESVQKTVGEATAKKAQQAVQRDYVRPEGMRKMGDLFSAIRKNNGEEAVKARRKQATDELKSASQDFWKGLIEPDSSKAYTTIVPLPEKSIDALTRFVKTTVDLGGKEFSDVYKIIRDLPDIGINQDFDATVGGKTQTIDHIKALAMAYERAVPGADVPEQTLKVLRGQYEAKQKAAGSRAFSDSIPTGQIPEKKSILFNASAAKAARELLVPAAYRPTGDKMRDSVTDHALNYWGGFTYEALARTNNKRPGFAEWVAEMKGSTGSDLSATDLTKTWNNLKEFAYHNVVKPKVDLRLKSTKDASKRLTAEQFVKYRELTKNIDFDSPQAPHLVQAAFNEAKGSFNNRLAVLSDVPHVLRAIRFSHDWSAILTHMVQIASDPRRLPETFQLMRTAAAAFNDRHVYEAAMAPLRDVESPMYYYYDKYCRSMFKDWKTNEEEIFSSQVLHRWAEQTYDKPTWTRIEMNRPEFMRKLQGNVGIDFTEHSAAGIKYLKAGDRVAPGDKMSFELNLAKQVARNVASSERHFTLFNNLYRKALVDAEFKRLIDQGYNPDIHEQVFQAAMDNIGIFTGATNLSKSSDVLMKTLSKIGSAPKYQISLIQSIMRPFDALVYSPAHDLVYGGLSVKGRQLLKPMVSQASKVATEEYKASNKAIENTPFHSTLSNRQYLARYVPKADRMQIINTVGGMAAGTALNIFMAQMAGAEVNLDPRHKNFMQARFAGRTFMLPGQGIWNLIRFAAQVGSYTQLKAPQGRAPKQGVNWPGQTGPNAVRVPMNGKFGADSATESFQRFMSGKEAPAPAGITKFLLGENALHQKVYRGRMFDDQSRFLHMYNSNDWMNLGKGIAKDLYEDTAPLSPKDIVDGFTSGPISIPEGIMNMLSLVGVDNKDTKFQKDPYYKH